ncbi:MAG: hypothetical protein QNJ89_03610 [Acidimicrobiia bacterium]|nr:hypothetical protein [Acidimicrobiia bacterium]
MSTDLRTQLAAYGDLFAADLDPVTVEDAMSTRVGEGKVKALEPVQRREKVSRRGRGPLLAAAVFIIVVAAGLALAFALRGTAEDVVEVPAPPFENPEGALAAFGAAIRAGDYDAWTSLLVDGVDNFFGNDAVTDQRKRERYEWNSLASTADQPSAEDVSCTPNDVVERSWTCTMPHPQEGIREILAAAGVLGGPVLVAEVDVLLSPGGLISRVSDLRSVDDSADHGQALFDFDEWWTAHDPELRAAEQALFFRSNHQSDPLLMPIPEMVERYHAAVADYVEFLESGDA